VHKTFHYTMMLCLCLALLFILVPKATASYMADITYDYVDNGGGNFDFIFTVFNTSTLPDTGQLDFFDILFDADTDLTLYSNVTWLKDKGWDAVAFEYDPSYGGLAATVLTDDSVLVSGSGGIAQGASSAGFTVNFDYAGALLPTDQLFTWDANFGTSDTDNGGTDMGGYWILGEADGKTRYVPSTSNPVPEPGTILFLALGFCGILGINRKHLKLF